ncbi:MAG: SPOR domain-containing protein [Candidatus Omnitrophota bacterium]
MENENHPQLELFSQIKDNSEKNAKARESFFNYMRNYEKQIILVICFFITAVVSFALGMEKGRKLATLRVTDARFDTAKRIDAPAIEKLVKTQSSSPAGAVTVKESIPAEESGKASLSEETKIRVPAEGFTVQVASYKTMGSAEKEAEHLRKRGFSPLVVPKGNFLVVCVGSFTNKKEAETLLTKLKSKYHDCYIRRL